MEVLTSDLFLFRLILSGIFLVDTGDACTGDVVLFEQNVYEM